jgi:NADPH:quinone reductase-like Zn-dependent oxidoreductase
VRVYSTGVIANELKWDATYETPVGNRLILPIPGRDLSGVVEEVGPGVTPLSKGSQVYAMLGYGRDGAEADYAIALPGELAPKPRTLDDVQAAAVPLTALTAWQALFEHAGLVAPGALGARAKGERAHTRQDCPACGGLADLRF